MNIWDRLMFGVMVLFALASNISTGITSVCIGLQVFIMVLQKIRTGHLPSFDKKLSYIIIIYVVLQFVIAIFSVHPDESFSDVLATIYRFLPLYWGIGYLRNEKQLAVLIGAFLFSLFATDMLGLYQHIVGGIARPKGFSGTATFYASSILMGLPIAYIACQKYRSSRKCVFIAASVFAFSLYMLYLSQTRGGWIAFGCMFIVLVVLDKSYRKTLACCGLVLLLILGGMLYSSPSLQDRTVSIVNTTTDNSNRSRLEMWNGSIAIFEDYPIVGIGQDQWQYVYNTKYISPYLQERLKGDYKSGYGNPHSNIFKVLSEGGILGMMAFLGLHGYILYRMFFMYQKGRSVSAKSYGMVGMLIFLGMQIEGLTDCNLTQVPLMREYWFLIGLLFGAYNLKQTDK